MKSTYRDSPEAIRALVQPDRVHRDVYIDEELFELEQQHFYGNTWNFVAHGSQLPRPGDYVTLDLAGRPLLVVRQPDGSVRVLYNRCAHKGTKLASDECGSAGKFIRCPYHAWTYKLDGAPLSIPLKAGYEGTGLAQCESGRGLSAVANVAVYRDFIFVKLNDAGPGFHEYFGESLQSIDNMVDRSPRGQLVAEGGVLRNVIRCNWKMYLENINDTVHPVSTHESATQAAKSVWGERPADEPKPMAIEQILPFGASYDFFDRMGARVYANGHSLLGVNFSIHSGYALPPEYEAALDRSAWRAARPRGARALAAELGVLPEPVGQGLAAGDPRDPPAGGRPHAGGGVELSRGRCARSAVRPHADLQPAGVLADVGGRARRRSPVRDDPAGPARAGQRVDQPASQLRCRARRRMAR